MGEVDHLNKEAVRDRVERLRDGRGVYPVPPRWTVGGADPISSLPGRAARCGGRSVPGLLASLPRDHRDYDAVLLNCWDVNCN